MDTFESDKGQMCISESDKSDIHTHSFLIDSYIFKYLQQ